jgi:hypothetical protein
MVVAGQPIAMRAVVRNHSPDSQHVRASLYLDGDDRPRQSEQRRIGGGRDVDFLFGFTFDTPGDHHGRIVIEREVEADAWAGDDLPADDTRHFAFNVNERVDVLLIKPRHELDRSIDSGFLLQQLASVRLGNVRQPIRLVERTPAELDNLPAMLGGVEVLITADVPLVDATPTAGESGLTPDQLEACRQFARGGGTWMIWLGPTIDLDRYNQWLGRPPDGDPSLLGGELVRYVGQATGGAGTEDEPVGIQWVNLEHEMFQGVFAPGDLSPYRQVLVHRYALLQTDPAAAGRVVARLSTNDPLVVDNPIGRGRVLLFTTATLGRWSGWLNQGQAFAVYQMLLASRPGRLRNYQPPQRVDLAALLDRPGGIEGGRVRIATPAGQRVELDLAEASTFDAIDQLGRYEWTIVEGEGEGRSGSFAVNPPSDESNLAAASEPQLQADLSDGRVVLVGSSIEELSARIAEFREGSPLWPYLFALVLVILAVEARLANRNRPVEGAARLRPAAAEQA